MFAIHARYRGRAVRRAELVARSAEALSTMEGVGTFDILGVEDICAVVDTPEAVADTTMALLSAGEWAIGIGIAPTATNPTSDVVTKLAGAALGARARVGVVKVRVHGPRALKPDADEWASDIAACFLMLATVLAKRSIEGREATSLMRRGYNQNEAAAELGITKQAMSQRLQAAGWQAETAGWQLAVNLLRRAEELTAAPGS
ncbi:MarR family transcriptional regulator [Corynebacterium hindlerae]|uniref:MarR family transcriptional regulator n=1 Tax=Corynebacterium hindlerae TaxID=699041 RepID=UPI001AD60708|nr:MarR family transcriptional regulator [Corynebacterium hindlerae]QTH58789.1 MarR family transcriptional regulator [Corynebacterium hindlerae]